MEVAIFTTGGIASIICFILGFLENPFLPSARGKFFFKIALSLYFSTGVLVLILIPTRILVLPNYHLSESDYLLECLIGLTVAVLTSLIFFKWKKIKLIIEERQKRKNEKAYNKVHMRNELYFNNWKSSLIASDFKNLGQVVKDVEGMVGSYYSYYLRLRFFDWLKDSISDENADIIVPFLCDKFIYGELCSNNKYFYAKYLKEIYVKIKDRDVRNSSIIKYLNGEQIGREPIYETITELQEVTHYWPGHTESNVKYDVPESCSTSLENVEVKKLVGHKPIYFHVE